MNLGGEGDAHRRARAADERPPATADRGRVSRASPLQVAIAALLLALLVAAALLVWRSLGDDVSGTSVTGDSVDAGSEPRVQLTNAAGRVRVEGVKGLDAVQYEATRYATAADPAAAKLRASEVHVEISREDYSVVFETDGGRETGADYTLRMPAGGALEVESEAGDVEISGLSGAVTVYAGAGDVTVRDAGGSVAVEAPQGDATVADVGTDTGGVELEVGSGDVALENVVVGTLEAAVETGDVTLSGRFSGGGRVSVETGDIVARLPSEDTRNLILETRVGEVLREPPDGDPKGASGDGGGER